MRETGKFCLNALPVLLYLDRSLIGKCEKELESGFMQCYW